MPFIKICDLQFYEEARLALDCGATALGFLVGLTHRAEDKLTDTAARDIVQLLPRETNTVLVTHLLDPNEIAKLATFIGVRTIQVHGDVSVTGVETLARLVPHLDGLKAVHVTGFEALLTRGLVLDS
jgi:phosphoribosylanthranilate isomerase